MPETTLRDALSEQYDKAEEAAGQAPDTATPGSDATVAPADASVTTPAQAAETAESKAGRTAGRARDDKGRLLPGPAKKEGPKPAAEAAAVVAPVEQKKINRPSSWKKDHWEAFDKLATENPALAEYINQREGDYAKGVSTYKQAWEQQGKPLVDAITPHLPVLKQYGIEPVQHVSALMSAHRQLALGSPQDKVAMFAKLAKDYQVPLEQLFVRDQQGQIFFNEQLLARAQQPQQQPQQQNVDALIDEKLKEREARLEAERMRSDTERFPHFEQVRETMVGLLQAGLAQDLHSAYDAAIRLPQHSDIFQAMQEQQRVADEAKKREEAAKAAQRARANAVSPKSATATGPANGDSAKGRRAVLEAAYEKYASGSSRV